MRNLRRPLLWIVFLILFGGFFYLADRYIPGQHLAWKSLETSRPLGLATKSQLFRLSLSSSKTCTELSDATLGFQTIEAPPKTGPKSGDGRGVCGFTQGRTVYGQGEITLSPADTEMQCPLSIAAYLWLREIDRIAEERYGYGLSKVHHMGSYSCRRQNGNASGQWSEHAFANAWDVAGFELENGHLVTVLKHWETVDQDAAFLRDIRDAACKLFRVTLSPDFNAAHRDHFHVDMGPVTSCR